MAIIGAVLGDIAGSRWEFGRPDDLDWEHIELFTDECFFTDDTVLTVATKYALQNGIPYEDAYYQFGNIYSNCSYGGSFVNWISFPGREPYGSFGNGSAMRVSPVVDLTIAKDEALWEAMKSAVCTHNHPQGIKGACVTAMCAWMAKYGASKKEIEEYANRQYPDSEYKFPVSMLMKDLRREYTWDVTCQTSVPIAIRCFLESENYESFLRNVISLYCDTDTLCAIGGCIAEEYYGGTGFSNETLLKKYLDQRLYDVVIS